MPAYRTQQDLIDYIAELERRITLLEQSAVRIDKTATRASATPAAGRIIYDTSGTPKLYAGNGSTWNALW
jgi:hypothetical protein